MSTNRQGSTTRRNRYARSSTTTSVTQLLSDSCSSLLQRLTTRVRGTSTTNDRGVRNAATGRRSPHTSQLGITRTRLEDKYSTILDKYSSKKRHDLPDQTPIDYSRNRERDHSYFQREDSPFVREEKTLEPSMTRTVVKSPTNVVLSEKAYPYVRSATGADSKREKTPAYHRTDRQTLLNSEAYRRYGRHKSGHAETRTRKVRPHRSGKSEQLEGYSTALRLARPTKGDPLTVGLKSEPAADPDKTPTNTGNCENAVDALQTIDADENDPTISERAAKRKEIQSLIMKYAAMEDAYSELAASAQAKTRPSTTDIIASKYRKSNQQNDCKEVSKSAVVSSVVNNADANTQDAIVSYRTAHWLLWPSNDGGVSLSRACPLLLSSSCLLFYSMCGCFVACVYDLVGYSPSSAIWLYFPAALWRGFEYAGFKAGCICGTHEGTTNELHLSFVYLPGAKHRTPANVCRESSSSIGDDPCSSYLIDNYCDLFPPLAQLISFVCLLQIVFFFFL